ncbi:hypothetical protein QTO34_005641 [Cnephaeus nilssonii]|uniref:MRG domain-containing protein n=1 Tax=Cnephaeus nilssonii TaxID=3371016 RepID=A0AA40LK40_CNENI|nr:hypothetical protein QTO34_005641 [Eptesicus nilssonii]
MLAYTPLDEKSLALLLNYLHDFLKYLAKNSATLFSASDYEVAPPQYHPKATLLKMKNGEKERTHRLSMPPTPNPGSYKEVEQQGALSTQGHREPFSG